MHNKHTPFSDPSGCQDSINRTKVLYENVESQRQRTICDHLFSAIVDALNSTVAPAAKPSFLQSHTKAKNPGDQKSVREKSAAKATGSVAGCRRTNNWCGLNSLPSLPGLPHPSRSRKQGPRGFTQPKTIARTVRVSFKEHLYHLLC